MKAEKTDFSFIEEADFEEVVNLYIEHLNGGDYIRKQIEKEFASEAFIGFKTKINNKIVAISYGTRGMGFTYPRNDIEQEVLDFLKNYDKDFEQGKLFSSDALLVIPEYRNEGFANELMLLLKEAIKCSGYRYVFVEMWRHEDGYIPADAPHNTLGEVIYRKVYLDFYKRLIDFGITCPICGENCKCGAQIEIIKL